MTTDYLKSVAESNQWWALGHIARRLFTHWRGRFVYRALGHQCGVVLSGYLSAILDGCFWRHGLPDRPR